MLKEIEALSNRRKKEILSTKAQLVIKGTTYFVSNNGNDDADGKSKKTAWRTLSKVSSADLNVGDGVLFKRGDIFRGVLKTKPGVSYGAFGKGDKPRLYGWDKNLARKDLWELVDRFNSVYKLKEEILDCGTLVFNGGEYHSYKQIPSYIGGKFVCRDDESVEFDIFKHLTHDLDIVCFCDGRLTTTPSRGQDFPVPVMDEQCYGSLYLKCDRGNPGEVFYSIEALPRRVLIQISNNTDVTIDNLCIKYAGAHAIGAYLHTVGLTVTNCEIGWIGGTVQSYFGDDPNYPQGGRGTVTRYGNGIEIYGGCENYTVKNNYIYQCYDAGITHQFTTNNNHIKMTGVRYENNLVENCVYSIEYFLQKKGTDEHTDATNGSYMDDIIMSGNILRLSGYGWGQQRHNKNTPAHIKGWSYENTASNYIIKDNIFDRAKFRIIHTVAREIESMPKMENNTYIQHSRAPLASFGANKVSEPEVSIFDDSVEDTVRNILGDKSAKIYTIKE